MSTNERDFGDVYYERGIQKEDQPVAHREHVSTGFHKMGEVLPYADRSSDIISGRFSEVGQSTYTAASDHTHNFQLPRLNKWPADIDFEDAKEGCMCVSTIGSARWLWVRMGGAWRYTVLTTV